MISITDPALSTVIFTAILCIGLLISIKRRTTSRLFPSGLTNELKGFAILTIVFSHIGYFLASNDRFLWPLSTMAGVGVNLFLFLSGYGLTVSSQKHEPKVRKHALRILRLFIPLWIVILIYFLLDRFVLHINYSHSYVIHSFVGIFPHADVVHDVNSVLWYFSLIFIYYLLFPFVYIKNHVWVSALVLFATISILVWVNPVALHDVVRLYRVHTIAFPLGMIAAWISHTHYLTLQKFFPKHFTTNNKYRAVRYTLIAILLFIAGFTAIHSNVGAGILKEQFTGLLSMSVVIALFVLKRFELRLLSVFGLVSYEIYLIHWPLLSRYDFLYKHSPAWLATALYLVIFTVVGFGLKSFVGKFFPLKKSHLKT